MISTPIANVHTVYCTNPSCSNPINRLDNRLCANCQTPLIQRYVWATGAISAKIQPGELVAERYGVISPQIWLDTKPGLLPDTPEELPVEVSPYLQLYPKRLHLPQVYGFTQIAGENILLLENIPVDEKGNLYPALADAWEQATALRQVNWLWQILELWQPLSELEVAGSLLIPNNIRIQGWCVRLLEFVDTYHDVSLQDLGKCWQTWIATAKTSVAKILEQIVEQMCSPEGELTAIATQLNKLLLSTVAELPLTLEVAGATDTGTQLKQNEDNFYPSDTKNQEDPLLPKVSIVCDGIGGHEGGEVASLLAVESLKLQIRALLLEVAEQTEIVPPDLLAQQIEASLRIVNNLICSSNDEQKREGTQRMGTTVIMALQIPQKIQTNSGVQVENAHELYIANVGDSRAYWITKNYCQLLTVDDDVAGREVRLARSTYRQALQRKDAYALSCALGTKNGEFLHPEIQRFILDEDGILLLCSDGLSDDSRIEEHWQDYSIPVLTGELSLEDAVSEWIKLANQKNGYDNTSVVLTLSRVSQNSLMPISKSVPIVEIVETKQPEDTVLLEDNPVVVDVDIEASTPDPIETPAQNLNKGKQKWWVLGGFLTLVVSGAIGLLAWWQINPFAFQQICQQLPKPIQQVCSTKKM
ncbi:protein phosphatase 2C domain-containing protein [Iningainema tapete]|uniref:Protein phosphatase 2C domain-containing protein n=1 Tax=Iningainema tapete BLCC-T55 TaxID=2748662 RepID=A0A8J6XBS6_9CYAN|nr:protein phosphatase 2C domain-containing protein [Iningainema tapete]MBD2772415.1 protein phosphatase 2C domain-containing protein [Iningainema tapete BLCC-T55]